MKAVFASAISGIGCRQPFLILMALAVCAAAWATASIPVRAQDQVAPVAIAKVRVTTPPDSPTSGIATLDGSGSFDPDPGGGIATYRWEVVTDAYRWLTINHASEQSPTATFEIPREELAAEYGRSIEFRLMVTDRGNPVAEATTTVAFQIDQRPTIAVTVSATLPNPEAVGVEDEVDEAFTIGAVIDGPGENGNANNEWDIKEGVRLVLDAFGSSGSSGRPQAIVYSWERIFISPDNGTVTSGSLPGTISDASRLVAHPSVGLLSNDDGSEVEPFYVYYRLTATGGQATSTALVKIVIHDQPVDPEVALDDIDDPDANTVQATARGNKYVVLPGTTVRLTARSTDGDGDSPSFTWTGAQPVDDQLEVGLSSATFSASTDVEGGTAFTVKVTATDVTGRSADASYELVIAQNRRPDAVAPNHFATSDGADGGDMAPVTTSSPDNPVLRPTGIQTLRGFGFDPDGGPLAYSWTEWALPIDAEGNLMEPGLDGGDPLTYDHDGDAGTPEIAIAPVPIKSPRKPVLSIDGASSESASFEVPEVDSAQHATNADGNLVVPIAFTVTDEWGVVDTEIVLVTITDDDDIPLANPNPRRQVSSGAFVRLNANVSPDADSDDVLAYRWRYVGIVSTHPKTQDRTPISAGEQAEGFVEGQWFPDAVTGNYDANAGGRFRQADTAYPYFEAPRLSGFTSVELRFELVVDRAGQESEPAFVTVTVVTDFYSRVISGPDFCTNLSLGGPTTFAFDSDGDGVADICSLNTTRRATVARQNALEILAALNPEAFEVPQSPPPVDPAVAKTFFSGVISGPDFCTNLSLGGPTTFAFDSDGDGVADICSLPFTKREAVARQEALNKFESDLLYPWALAAACITLGTIDFGDSPENLATDLCNPQSTEPRGTPLPILDN